MEGNLRVKVRCAHFVKDADLIGKMDPFVVIEVGTQRERTSTKQEAGKAPIWNEEFFFILNGQTDMFIKCCDEDPHSVEDIGIARVFLKQLEFKVPVEKDIALTYPNSNKHSGILALTLELDRRSDYIPEEPGTWAQPVQNKAVVKGPGYVPKGQFSGPGGFQPPSYPPQYPPY